MPIDLPIENNNIAIVLVRPKYDGNIGAVARTVLNFGITDLRIDCNGSDDGRDKGREK